MAHFTVPRHILTGTGALKEAVPFLQSYGKRALVVTGKHVAQSFMMQELKKALEDCGIEYIIYDGITGEPTDVMIVEGKNHFINKECDFCIGIGGGSPLDSAKAIAAMVSNKGSISQFCKSEIRNRIPVAAIPTTAGTGSEATKFTVITDSVKNIKMLLKGEELIPDLAIIETGFGLTAPKQVTASTGLDALTHAIEAYTSRKSMPLTDVLAISAIKRIMRYLPIAYRNGKDINAREEMALAALEAGICINNSSVTLVHGLSRPIGALFHVPHGLSNAMLLKECLQFAMDGAIEKFSRLGRETGAAKENDPDEISAQRFIQEIEKLCRLCEVPSLKQYGIDKEEYYNKIDKMSKDALDSGSPGNTVKEVTIEDCKRIYRAVYQGLE